MLGLHSDNHPEITVRSQDVQVHWGWTGSCRCPAAGMCGSLRRGSHNRRLLTAAAAELPAGDRLEVFERLAELPPYNEDIEVPEPAELLRTASSTSHAGTTAA